MACRGRWWLLSHALSVPFTTRPSAAPLSPILSQTSLTRIVGLLRRQYSASLQWFLDTSSSSSSTKAFYPRYGRPVWNPSINPSTSSLHPPKFSATIRLHSHWQPDGSGKDCGVCTTTFGLLKRKHHCRLCGMVACDECTRKTVELTEVGLPGQQRVCDLCETVWTVGRGLKHIGDRDREKAEGEREKERENEPEAAIAVAAATAPPTTAAKASRRGTEDTRKVGQEAAVTNAAHPPLHRAPPPLTTPTVSRVTRKADVSKKASEKEAAAPAKDVKRVTRSAASKENVNANLPATPMEVRRKRLAAHTPSAAPKTVKG